MVSAFRILQVKFYYTEGLERENSAHEGEAQTRACEKVKGVWLQIKTLPVDGREQYKKCGGEEQELAEIAESSRLQSTSSVYTMCITAQRKEKCSNSMKKYLAFLCSIVRASL